MNEIQELCHALVSDCNQVGTDFRKSLNTPGVYVEIATLNHIVNELDRLTALVNGLIEKG